MGVLQCRYKFRTSSHALPSRCLWPVPIVLSRRYLVGPSVFPERPELLSSPRPGLTRPHETVSAADAGRRGMSMSKRLYVGNLSFDTTEQELQNLFEPYGGTGAVIPTDHDGRSKGF